METARKISLEEYEKVNGDIDKIPAIQETMKRVAADKNKEAKASSYIADSKTVNGIKFHYPTLAHRWMIDTILVEQRNNVTISALILYILSHDSEDCMGELQDEYENQSLVRKARDFVVQLGLEYKQASVLAIHLIQAGSEDDAVDDEKKTEMTDSGGQA